MHASAKASHASRSSGQSHTNENHAMPHGGPTQFNKRYPTGGIK
jgi:hypothetical protein